MYIITYFVGHKLKAQFVFSSSVFPNCFTKNNSATREKQIKSIWEALPSPVLFLEIIAACLHTREKESYRKLYEIQHFPKFI